MKDRIFTELHNEIINKIKPSTTTQKKVNATVNKLIKRVNQTVKNSSLDYKLEPILVGSVAKDTYLEDPDIDIFIMFPKSIPVVELKQYGLEIGYAVLPDGEERYAEHPYISGKFNGFDTDIVPCYKLTNISDRMTAVDRTPFHTRFIKAHLHTEQHDEVRLLKQFLKGIDAYGAEIEVQGFSGYLCELLILYYGTFLNVLKAAINWPGGLVLKLTTDKSKSLIRDKSYREKSTFSPALSRKFRQHQLVFIDPVDSNRNVASALEPEQFDLFITASKAYQVQPRREFFFPKPIKPLSITQLKKLLHEEHRTILSVAFETPEVVPDILHGQLRKCQKAIRKLLDTAGFGVVHSKYFDNNRILILFELKLAKLPDMETHYGPPVDHVNANDFLAKWRIASSAMDKPYQKDGRWVVDIKREFTEPLDLVKANISHLNVGKHVTESIKKKLELHQNTNVIRKGYEKPLTQFLIRRNSWEY